MCHGFIRKSLDVAKIEFENEITKVAIKNVETTLDTMKDCVATTRAAVGQPPVVRVVKKTRIE